MFKRIATAIALMLIALPATSGDIYRCVEDQVTVFSDQPCDADAQPLSLTGNLSVIPTPEGLDEIAASNRAWMEARRTEQARLREARTRAAAKSREDTQPAQPTPVIQHGTVYHPFPYPRYGGEESRREHQGHRSERDGKEPESRISRAHEGRRATDLSRDRSRRRATDLHR